MNKLKAVAEWYQSADAVLCTTNTYRPEVEGTVRFIEKAGATVAQCTLDGEAFRIEYPKRAKDVISVTDDELSYYLGSGRGDERLAGHYVTHRKVAA